MRFRALSLLGLSCLPASGGCQDEAKFTVEAGPAALASSDRGPPQSPPQLRVKRIATPALPDLPALTSREGPPSPPAGSNAANPCKSVFGGDETAPLGCAQSLLFGSGHGNGAVAVVPRRLLSRDLSSLPAIVDHRLDGTEGPIRNQADAPACTAFATAAALDHALARWGGGNPSVSVMQIWSRYHSPQVETSLESNIGQPVGPEQHWPFVSREAISWVPCRDFSRTPSAGCGQPVSDPRARTIGSSPVGDFTEIEYLGKAPDTSVLQSKLAAGQDLMLTLELPSTFTPKGTKGAMYIPDYTRSAGPDAGHALLIAGYVHLAHGTYFLLHNSWGTTWGDGGYAWLHEATLRRWSHEVVALDAEPVQRGEGSRPRPRRASTTCAGGLVPDSIRATCAPPCPDHSPRHDDVCPVGGQCPAGMVNLTGACVLAAPSTSGADPDSDIKWTCGPGGCSYELPRDVDPACTGGACRTSCPAPDFILAKMGSALVCIE